MPPLYPQNNRNLKLANRLLIRSLVREHEPVSRKELARLSRLTPAAVTSIVRELLEDGTVLEVGHGQSQGGRRPIYLTLNASAGYVLACRLQKNYLLMALVDLKSQVVAQEETAADTSSPETVAAAMFVHFPGLLAQAGISAGEVSAIGVASPGLVNQATGVIRRSVNLGWHKAPLGPCVSQLFGLPTQVENVSNASALAEKLYGHGRGCSNLVYVGLSVGIGAGIIVNGQILGGTLGYAGEVGHLAVTAEGGALCRCGNRGCFEAYCGTSALVERVRTGIVLGLVAGQEDGLAENLDLAAVFRMWRAGEPYVRTVFTETAAIVGLVVANLVNLLNPGVVVLGGELMDAGEEFLALVRKEVAARALGELAEEVRILRSGLTEDTGMKGAAALALQKVFDQVLVS
jgi:predicted NBD/HSP70 family sugar kinase